MNFLTVKKISNRKDKEVNNEFIYLNLDSIGFIKIQEETEIGLILETKYRLKATEKIKRFKKSHTKDEFRKFIAQYKFYLLENYFINTKAITFVDEEIVSNSEIKLIFYFIDGQNISIKTKKARWNDWRNLRLK